MYSFHIVRAKYSRSVRNAVGITILLLLWFGYPFLASPLFEKFKHVTDNHAILIFGYIIMFSPVALFFPFYPKVLGITYLIGTLEFTEQKLNILTKEISKQIPFIDIQQIRFRIGTGIGGSYKTSGDTFVTSIILKDRTVLKIHVTREWFKDEIKQKKYIWNKNIDFFDVLEKNKIRFEYNKHLKEEECL